MPCPVNSVKKTRQNTVNLKRTITLAYRYDKFTQIHSFYSTRAFKVTVIDSFVGKLTARIRNYCGHTFVLKGRKSVDEVARLECLEDLSTGRTS